jgi:hypothetical protein
VPHETGNSSLLSLLCSDYSWPWLESADAAKDMAKEVAAWPDKYGCDGIDLVRPATRDDAM